MAVGLPTAGRLVRGVHLPARGAGFVTWDPNLRRSPNRAWRRWGTDRLVRLLLAIAREHRRVHPGARPLLFGDLSRPHGGDFGRQFGYVWHASHQNGLDADIYYPRKDRSRRAPRTAADIDRRLSQDLVDRFVRAGATKVFVGPGTGLTGPPAVVQVIRSTTTTFTSGSGRRHRSRPAAGSASRPKASHNLHDGLSNRIEAPTGELVERVGPVVAGITPVDEVNGRHPR